MSEDLFTGGFPDTMHITLVRHGRSSLAGTTPFLLGDFSALVTRYDQAGIDPKSLPPKALVLKTRTADYVVCSDLRRSVESARCFNTRIAAVSDRLFREADTPCGYWERRRFPLWFWLFSARILWLLNRSRGAENYSQARKRADECAARLCTLAHTHGSVVLVGHGIINSLIARSLRKRGWTGPRFNPTCRNWHYTEYVPGKKYLRHR